MKKTLVVGLLAAAALSASPASACGFFCHIGNLFKCGDWTCHNNTPPPPPPVPSNQTSPTPTQQPKPTQQPPEPPGGQTSGGGTTPDAGKNVGAPVVGKTPDPLPPAPKPAPPPGAGDSTSLVSGGSTPQQKAAPAGGGGVPAYGPKPGGDTADVGVAMGRMVALNTLTDADRAKLDPSYGEVAARPALLASPQAPSFEMGQQAAKPQEHNIYTTVGAIPGVTDAKTPELQALQLAKSMMNKFAMKDWEGVISDASSLIKLQPNNAGAWMRRGEAYLALGRWAEAESDLRRAVELDPTSAEAWKKLGWALLRQGKFKEAEESFSRAIALNPHDAEAYMMRAYAREGLGDEAGKLRDAAMAAALDARFAAKYELAKSGGRIFNPEEDDETLLGVASAKTKHRRSPWALLLGFAGLTVLVGAGAFAVGKKLRARGAVQAQQDVAPVAEAPVKPEPRRFVPGTIVGKYQLGRIVGRGGMGQVFEAVDLSLGRPVAIKRMTEQVAQLGPQARGQFLKEARTVAQLHHPAVVEIYEILEDGDDLFLVFELVRGKTAQQLLVESGKLPLASVVQLLKPVSEALDFAHARALVHRDLKPGNIMLTEQGHVKLMDFGIARSLEEANVPAVPAPVGAGTTGGSFARTNIVAGTPEYRPPEADLGVVCKEGDVYSLGVTAYELLTGKLPYSPTASADDKAALRYAAPSALAPGLSPKADEAIARALQASPERRLKTPGEFFALLAAALA